MKTRLCVCVAAFVLAPMTIGIAAEDETQWQTRMEEKLSKPVTVNFQETTLAKALDFFRQTGGINIVLDSRAGDMAEKRLTLRIKSVRLESGLAWTARLMGLDYAVRNEAIFLSKPDDMPADWRGEMQERYRRSIGSGQEPWMADIETRLAKPLKVNFHGDQLPQVVEYLATETGLNIVLDYHLENANKPVKLEGEMSALSVLKWIAQLADVKYVIRDEVVYVAGQEAIATLHLETGESALSLLFRRPVTFHFQQTPLREAFDRLSRYSNVTIDLQGLKPDDTPLVTVEGEQVELNRAVRMVMNETGRPYAISYRGTTIVVVVSPKSKSPPKESVEPKKTGG